MVNHSNLTVVIRAAGERTADLCHRLVVAQTGEQAVTIIEERPFARAQQRSIEIALQKDRTWSMFLDADVMLRPEGVRAMLKELERCSHTFYMMNFLVLDQGFGGPAYGVHCYRTELFAKAVKYMKVAWQDQRPETRLCKEMAKRGIPTILSRTIVGLHDYEQYYRDFYRKTFVRAVKFTRAADYLSRRLRRSYASDPECRVMMWGLIDGVLYGKNHKQAPLDVEFYRDRSADVLNTLGMHERTPLEDLEHDLPIEARIDAFTPDHDYQANAHWIAPDPGATVYYGFSDRRDRVKRGLKFLKRLARAVQRRTNAAFRQACAKGLH